MDVLRAEFVTSAASREGFPRDGLPEIAFVGRSNVGKSSLLNKLANRKALARTSATPGKTRLVNFFRVERRARSPLLFVDLPGYGWARVARKERAEWQQLIEGYLGARAPLRGVLLLLDARRDPGDDERETRLRGLTKQLGIPREVFVLTSAHSGAGIDALWSEIDALLGREAGAAAP
jgi:GTP-binding protein